MARTIRHLTYAYCNLIAGGVGSHTVLYRSGDDHSVSLLTLEIEGELVDVPITHDDEWDFWAPMRQAEWEEFTGGLTEGSRWWHERHLTKAGRKYLERS